MIEEKRDFILGLQLCRTYAQLTYFNSSMKEPSTICCQSTQEGQETSDPGNAKKNDSYLIKVRPEEWSSASEKTASLEALKTLLERCLEKVGEKCRREDIRIMVTVPQLAAPLDERIPKALEELGVERKYIFLQDYKSSFYYYTVNQKRELWSGDVALLEYEEDTVTGYVLHIDRSTRPAIVTVEQAASQRMDESLRDGRSEEDWNRERDRLFFELLKKVFERRNVVTSYLLGDYFDKSWAVRSFQYLCYHRHAFQGKNLYTKGACYGAMERMGLNPTSELLFMGADIVRENVGMYLRARGKELYYPLITAGVNWYEAHHTCEIIPDGEEQITLITKPMTGGQEVEHVLRLKEFPNRPNRSVRLRLTVYFVSAKCCRVEAEDLGFGGLYRSSGKRWKREITF